MRELGSEGPESWTAAWESRGEVVLPQRRRSLQWRVGLTLLLVVNACLVLLDNLQEEDESTFVIILSAVSVAFWIWFAGYTTWQLITRRPVIRIDHSGIRYGVNVRTRIAWGRIATVSEPIGRWVFAHVNVRPYGGKPRRLPISHMHVDDLQAFAVWLHSLLENQRELQTHDRSVDVPADDQ